MGKWFVKKYLNFDRASYLRETKDFSSLNISKIDLKVIEIYKENFNVKKFKNKSVKVNWIKNDKAISLIESGGLTIFIGKIKNVYYFAKEVVVSEEKEKNFSDLRTLNPLLEDIDLALLTTSKGLFYWHRNNKFCSFCGSSSIPDNLGHSRICTNCNKRIFPRIDPAVIMLVEYRPNDGQSPMCLLANHYRFPGNIYSTLAGFVEPGESLEDTVAREVYEEVGLRVNSIGYQASQPWPFPSSIMLGYRARAEMTEIKIDREEIKDAKWFTVEEIRDFGEWGDKSVPRALPRKDSIARFLIDLWVSELIK